MLTPLVLLENVFITGLAFCAWEDWKTRQIEDWHVYFVYATACLYALISVGYVPVFVFSAILWGYYKVTHESEMGLADLFILFAIGIMYGGIIMVVVTAFAYGLGTIYKILTKKKVPFLVFIYLAISLYLAIINFPSTFWAVYWFINPKGI